MQYLPFTQVFSALSYETADIVSLSGLLESHSGQGFPASVMTEHL